MNARTPAPIVGFLLLLGLVPALTGADPAAVPGAVDARMFRYPAVSRKEIAFVYAGDIWVATDRPQPDPE